MAKKSDSGQHPAVRELYEVLETVINVDVDRCDQLLKKSERLLHSVLFGEESPAEILKRLGIK